MKPPLHWQIAIWNAVLVLLVFLLFDSRNAVLAYAVVAFLGTAVVVSRLKRRVSDPLRDLASSLERARGRDPVLPVIQRGSAEVNALSRTLRGWSGEVVARLRELSDSRIRLESILGAMAEGVLVFNSTGRVILSNTALRGRFEVYRDPLGRTCLEVFRNERLDRAVRNALDGLTPDSVEFTTASGRVVRALVSAVPGEDGEAVEAAVMVLQDLTDIRQVDRVRRDFVANVSHEFKTPLTSIRGYTETMLGESPEGPHRDFVEIIHRNARYLESLVNGLLALARIESQPSSSIEIVDISAVVAEQVGLRKMAADAEGFDIEIDCPSLEVRIDRGRLAMALSNLLDNAIRYNEPPGGIRVTCSREGPHVVLAVRDEGVGIPEDELPRIFERFYRVDKARTPNGSGTGLGLAIARHAIEGQGGELTVQSRVGKGSTFTIRLPAASPSAADVPESVDTQPASR
jgi:two-component system phosphate regulon sensor histidine kinase PhoR